MRRLSPIFLFVFLLSLNACSQQPSDNGDTPNTRLTSGSNKGQISIGEQIRKARLSKGISQEDLASAVGMRQTTLSLVEDGLATPIYSKLVLIQEFLDVEFVMDL